MTIRIKLTPASQRYLKQFKEGSQREKLYGRILKIMDKQGAITAGFISRNYLAGQRLNRISGTLARSVVGQSTRFRGLPAMRIGILTGPALHYAGILEFGTQDKNSASPFTNDSNGLPLSGRRPRFYLRDGMEKGITELSSKLEDLLVGLMQGTLK